MLVCSYIQRFLITAIRRHFARKKEAYASKPQYVGQGNDLALNQNQKKHELKNQEQVSMRITKDYAL